MYNQIEDCEKDGFDVAEAAARPPNWFSYSCYSMQQEQLQNPSYQYPDPSNTGEWYSAPSAPAEISAAASTATTYLGHHTATPSQTTPRRAQASPLHYGQNPAFAGTAAESAYPTTPLQQDGYYEADSTFALTSNSALRPPLTTTTASFAYGERRPPSENTSSDDRKIASRRSHSSTLHPHQLPEKDYNYHRGSHPTFQYLQLPSRVSIAPTSGTSPVPTETAYPTPSPAPSSTMTQTGFAPQQCKWEGCSSSHWFDSENGLVRHVRTIHISPNAYPCRELECTKAFGRNDHLLNHQRKRHGL